MKRTFVSLVLGSALLVGGGGAGLAQDLRSAMNYLERNDYTAAARELGVLAGQGNTRAQTLLGALYSEGQGVVQNYREAVKWYRLAAEQGDGIAQYNLGAMYFEGQGVTQDYMYAHMWFNIAASNGTGRAIKFRDFVAGKMTAAQIARAQELARQCAAKHYKGC